MADLIHDPKLLGAIKVRFRGVEYWLMEQSFPGGNRSLAPLEHCDERGDIKNLCIAFTGIGFAILQPDGAIWRLRRQIGTQDDLEIV